MNRHPIIDHACREQGFTLVELLVFLALTALAAALVAPQFDRTNRGIAIRTAALDLAAQLRATRAAAIADNMEKALTLDLAGRHFWPDGHAHPRTMPQNLTLELAIPASDRLGPDSGRLRFFPDGASNGGRITLKDGNRFAVVIVDWMTGNARIEWSR